MTKKSKLVKNALKQPHMFSQGELAYFQLWLKERKVRKAAKKRQSRLRLEQTRLNLEQMLLL
jgi:hypothetical protein